MGGILSTIEQPKTPPGGTITDIDRAILDLKNSRDRLGRYRAKLAADEAKLLNRAKECKAAGKTNLAVGLLRLRKHKQLEAENVNAQLLTVLEMVDTISGKEREKEVIDALRVGKSALQHLHEEMSVDDILNLVDDVREQSELEGQINDILKEGAVALSPADENEIEAELAELVGELEPVPEKTEELPNLPDAPNATLPKLSAPTTDTKVQKETGRVAVPS